MNQIWFWIKEKKPLKFPIQMIRESSCSFSFWVDTKVCCLINWWSLSLSLYLTVMQKTNKQMKDQTQEWMERRVTWMTLNSLGMTVCPEDLFSCLPPLQSMHLFMCHEPSVHLLFQPKFKPKKSRSWLTIPTSKEWVRRRSEIIVILFLERDGGYKSRGEKETPLIRFKLQSKTRGNHNKAWGCGFKSGCRTKKGDHVWSKK